MQQAGRHWRGRAGNSLWAVLGMFVALLVLVALRVERTMIVTSIGATAFILFMKPGSTFASPRSVIGGHLIGLAAGALVSLTPSRSTALAIALPALGVGLSLFAMSTARADHPPAAGTALSVALTGISWQIAAAVLVAVVLLVIVQRLVLPYLADT